MCLEMELISTRDYHFIPGRIRVSVPMIKGNSIKAKQLERELCKLRGISCKVNSVTGRVLVYYNQGQEAVPWHILKPEQVLQLTGTDLEKGLSTKTTLRRLELYGPNQLTAAEKKSILEMLSESLKGFMSQLLLGAAIVSLFVGDKTDAMVITSIVVLQGVLETLITRLSSRKITGSPKGAQCSAGQGNS